MDHILHRHTRFEPPMAAGGIGPYVVDIHGNRYLDACGGAAVSCLGHSNRFVIDAIKEQLDRLPYAHTSFFSTAVAEELADFLIDAAPENLERVYLVSGGSEAVESALKLARQYFVEIGQSERTRFIARRQSFHGNTLTALGVGGNLWRRRQFEPLLVSGHHISPCYAYRHRRDDETEEEYGLRAADELENKLLEVGPETVIAFVAETVVGATAGALTAAPGYFRRIREICDRYGVLLILDEVMCGMGRTGTLFACEQEGISGDIVTIAKAFGGGYQPVGAALVSGAIFDALRDGSGFFQHGHTYLCHPAAAAGALAVQKVIRKENLLQNIRRQGDLLFTRLRERFRHHRHVGDIRGRGLFIGLELVENRDNKRPFGAEIPLHTLVKRAAMKRGLMVYPMSGTIDGREGHHVLLAPPYIIEEKHVEEIVEKLHVAIDDAILEARPDLEGKLATPFVES